MPIYEYGCKACGNRIEAFQGIHDLPLTECQACHQPTLEKLVSASLFRLKGGGWYETDFKKEHDKKKNVVSAEGESVISASPSPDKATKTTSKTDSVE